MTVTVYLTNEAQAFLQERSDDAGTSLPLFIQQILYSYIQGKDDFITERYIRQRVDIYEEQIFKLRNRSNTWLKRILPEMETLIKVCKDQDVLRRLKKCFYALNNGRKQDPFKMVCATCGVVEEWNTQRSIEWKKVKDLNNLSKTTYYCPSCQKQKLEDGEDTNENSVSVR